MRIMGFDPGLRHCGFGVIEGTGAKISFVACGVISPSPKLSMEKRLLELFNQASLVLTRFQPALVGIEEVFVSINSASTLKLGQARAMCLLAPAVQNIPLIEIANRTIKKAVSASGRADKNQVQAMIRVLLPGAQFDNEHSADALATAITAHQLHSHEMRIN